MDRLSKKVRAEIELLVKRTIEQDQYFLGRVSSYSDLLHSPLSLAKPDILNRLRELATQNGIDPRNDSSVVKHFTQRVSEQIKQHTDIQVMKLETPEMEHSFILPTSEYLIRPISHESFIEARSKTDTSLNNPPIMKRLINFSKSKRGQEGLVLSDAILPAALVPAKSDKLESLSPYIDAAKQGVPILLVDSNFTKKFTFDCNHSLMNGVSVFSPHPQKPNHFIPYATYKDQIAREVIAEAEALLAILGSKSVNSKSVVTEDREFVKHFEAEASAKESSTGAGKLQLANTQSGTNLLHINSDLVSTYKLKPNSRIHIDHSMTWAKVIPELRSLTISRLNNAVESNTYTKRFRYDISCNTKSSWDTKLQAYNLIAKTKNEAKSNSEDSHILSTLWDLDVQFFTEEDRLRFY